MSQARTTDPAGGDPAGRPRIMLVEDDFLVRLSLSETLSDEGWEVVQAETGEEAVSLLESLDGLALLMTDMQLSGAVDGRAVAAAARVRSPDLPVLFMTGRPESVGDAKGPRDVIVSKPFLPSEIAAHVRRSLAL
jgi:CheY-like chemotaxis protein